MDKSQVDKSQEDKPKANTFTGTVAVAALNSASQGLLFPSETDAPIEPFFWPAQAPETPSAELIAEQLIIEAATVKTQSLSTFFKPVVAEEEWQNEAEKAEVKRFQGLRDTVKSHLSGAKVFRVGKVEIEVYVVGCVADGYAGFKTKVVET